MLVLNSLLTLTFSYFRCFLLTNCRLIKFDNGWKDMFGVLDKHAYSLSTSILHGSYTPSFIYILFAFEYIKIITFKLVFVFNSIDIMFGK